MKPPVIFTLIFSVILAVVVYFLPFVSSLSANLAIALGIILGGLVVPLLVSLVNKDTDATINITNESTTLYVGNLPYRANEQAVKEHFELEGKVHSVRLMKDRRTGKRKGYGFVEVGSRDADRVISNLNDSEFQDRTLKVRLAKEKV